MMPPSLRLAACLFAAAGALQIVGNTSAATSVGETLHLTILLTRHAFSCANAAKEFPDTGGFTRWEKVFGLAHILVKDPLLTECGAYRSRVLRKFVREKLEHSKIPPVSYILTSHLLRAMETAAYMYGGDGATIVPVPFISEKGFGLDNNKKRMAEQKKATGNITRFEAEVNWTWIESYGETLPDWTKFLRFFELRLFPTLKETLFPGKVDAATIAVVTHSHFMLKIPDYKEHCAEGNQKARKPKNNEVFALRYKVEVSEAVIRTGEGERQIEVYKLTPDDGKGPVCLDLLKDKPNAQEKLEPPTSLCEHDVGCDKDLVQTKIKTEKGQCCTSGEDWRKKFLGDVSDYNTRRLMSHQITENKKKRTELAE